MIQAAMLIALGFLIASLIGVLMAPSLWSRAYRLSRRRLEMTLPMSLSEIDAARDRLHAGYAVKLRRLESGLGAARQRAALQLVENSRLQMQLLTFKDEADGLNLRLSERRNAASVLEQTLETRLPELERHIIALQTELRERSGDVQSLSLKLLRRGESLEAAERKAQAFERELQRLRDILETGGSDKKGRRLRRPSQWDLDDYKSEYDRLNLELSKLRQQLTLLQERDSQQTALIKGELQKLAELALAAAPMPAYNGRGKDTPAPALSKRTGASDLRVERPVPWPAGSGAVDSDNAGRPAVGVPLPHAEGIVFDKRLRQVELSVATAATLPAQGAAPQRPSLLQGITAQQGPPVPIPVLAEVEPMPAASLQALTINGPGPENGSPDADYPALPLPQSETAGVEGAAGISASSGTATEDGFSISVSDRIFTPDPDSMTDSSDYRVTKPKTPAKLSERLSELADAAASEETFELKSTRVNPAVGDD